MADFNLQNQSLILSPALRLLFDSAKIMKSVEGRIASNLDYMPYLEGPPGHSQQAPDGIIAPHLAEYRAILEARLRQGLKSYPTDPQQAAMMGVSGATLDIMALMMKYTPVDTGRAKGSWTAYLPGGRGIQGSGAVITAEMQRAILNARRVAAAKARATK
jgi:hypothetical protein